MSAKEGLRTKVSNEYKTKLKLLRRLKKPLQAHRKPPLYDLQLILMFRILGSLTEKKTN